MWIWRKICKFEEWKKSKQKKSLIKLGQCQFLKKKQKSWKHGDDSAMINYYNQFAKKKKAKRVIILSDWILNFAATKYRWFMILKDYYN